MSMYKREALSKRALKITAMVIGALLVSAAVLAIDPVSLAAKPVVLTEKPQAKVGNKISVWYYSSARDSKVAATISKGIKKDTTKVVRTIRNDIKGMSRGVSLDISKEIKLTYEIYTSGAKKGELYRINKPQIKHVSKKARYLGLIKLTVSPKIEVVSYSIDQKGRAVVLLTEQTKFTLPRQFPLRRDTLTELLRQSFNIESKAVERTIVVMPQGQYGTVQLDLGG